MTSPLEAPGACSPPCNPCNLTIEGTIRMPNQAQVTADIGLIGLAVMGENLALNIADHGFKCAVYNRTTATMRAFVEREKHPNLIPCENTDQLVKAVKRPRKFII